MIFRDIVNAVLADGFGESKRADAKNWVNFRYGWIFDVDEWTFTQGSANVAVTGDSNVVTGLPADFGIALDLFRADGTRLQPIPDYRDYAALYLGSDNSSTGQPEAYTVWGGSLLVGPTSSETSSGYLLVYEKAVELLSADGDEPAIPAQYHMALVHGGKAEGFKLINVDLSASFDADFQAAITAMRRKYLRSMRGTRRQVPAWRPDRPGVWAR